jgi:hypothetical protein
MAAMLLITRNFYPGSVALPNSIRKRALGEALGAENDTLEEALASAKIYAEPAASGADQAGKRIEALETARAAASS